MNIEGWPSSFKPPIYPHLHKQKWRSNFEFLFNNVLDSLAPNVNIACLQISKQNAHEQQFLNIGGGPSSFKPPNFLICINKNGVQNFSTFCTDAFHSLAPKVCIAWKHNLSHILTNNSA